MIQELFLSNFQAHHRLSIELSPTVTTIIGPTDVGKSAVLRALRWVSTNKPSGDKFRRWGTKRTRVGVLVDGVWVTRVRGTDRNVYMLDEEVLEAFGNDVPEPVSRLLNIREVNFQKQHDPYFWFSLSPGEVSKELNKIVNLDEMDGAVAAVGKELRSARSILQVTEDRHAQAIARRKQLLWVVGCNTELKEVEEVHKELRQVSHDTGVLAQLVQDGDNHAQRRRVAKDATQAALPVLETGELWGAALVRVERLRDQLHFADMLEETANLPVPTLEELETLHAKLAKCNATRLSQMVRLADRKRNERWELQQQLEEVEQQLSRFEKCPMCGALKKSSESSPETST